MEKFIVAIWLLSDLNGISKEKQRRGMGNSGMRENFCIDIATRIQSHCVLIDGVSTVHRPGGVVVRIALKIGRAGENCIFHGNNFVISEIASETAGFG